MEDDWDSEFTPAPTLAPASLPAVSKSSTGHGVGRGRGFVGKPKEINNVTSNNNGWNSSSNGNNNNDSLWDESSNSLDKKQFEDHDTGGWNGGGGFNSSGGGGGGGGRRGGGGGGRNMVCFKCKQECQIGWSRNFPSSGSSGKSFKGGNSNSSGGGKDCHKCGETGHMSRDCPSGGGGGGQKRSCFKCGDEGHMSRDCPKGGGDSQRRNTCFKCGGEGHMSRDCPDGGGDNQKRGNNCFKCGEEGHMSRDCPNGGGDGQKRGSGCFKCGEEGHMSRDCPNGGGDGQKRGSGCFKCGEEGHMSRDCPNGGGDGQKRGSGCFKCGEDGHMSRDCPKAGSGDGGKRGCFKCGEDGHISKDCTNAEKTRTTVGEDGKTREIYVPPDYTELDDDDTSVPTGINFEKYDNIKVEVSGSNVPKAVLAFSEAGFSPTLMKNIVHANYTKPTPVQKYTIPIVRAGRDIMACAQTGSGKTAAFLLPIIQMMFEASDLPNNTYASTQEPCAVIISPTRELAIQIQKEAARFAKESIVKVGLIYGGTSVSTQLQRLSKGCHILVATPGRLDDFVEKGKVSFEKVKFIILDEADRMLDLGFGPIVRKLVEHQSMPNKNQRQTLLFSATFPDEIQKMSADFLKPDYLFLRVGMVGAANTDVSQTVLQVERFSKRDKLLQILQESGDNDRTLVFVETKRQADFVASFISQKNFICTSIHGDRLQREREEALNDFRSGLKPILTATAVAARGLDIKDVRHVINYDMPKSIDEYVHRIGRTGRVGNTGQSTSFFDPNADSALAGDLVKILSDAQQEVPDWLEALCNSSSGYSGGASNFTSRDVRQGANKSTWQNDNVVTNGEESWD